MGTIQRTSSWTIDGTGLNDLSPTDVTESRSQTTAGAAEIFRTIGTSEEDVAFTDLTPGPVRIHNLDETNFVQFGPKSAGSMVLLGRIRPGGYADFELETTATLRMIADTAACNIKIAHCNN